MGSEREQQRIRPPEKLRSTHQLEDFDSGIEPLDSWLKRRALGNEAEGASRTYVVCAGNVVVGYYCLSNGAIASSIATGKVRRNMPDPIPVMIIGRLAVDRSRLKKSSITCINAQSSMRERLEQWRSYRQHRLTS